MIKKKTTVSYLARYPPPYPPTKFLMSKHQPDKAQFVLLLSNSPVRTNEKSYAKHNFPSLG